jgi:hypothetical protein
MRAVFFVVNQHMQLRCSGRRLVRLVEYTGPLNLVTKSSNSVLEPVIMHRNIIRIIRCVTVAGTEARKLGQRGRRGQRGHRGH